jgi:hypothetical protein
MAEVTPEFSKFAMTALGTDDAERIQALKEAIVVCVEEHMAGGYEDEEEAPAEGGLSSLFGGVK